MSPFLDATAWILPVVLAITLHEVAHGWMAEKFGDNTARMMGRITLNPLKHIDRFGTIIFPALLLLIHSPVVFGYAKPVPVNFNNLTPKNRGMFMVALAGPGTNILLAILCGLLLHIDHWITQEQAPWVFLNLYRGLMINCVLAIFNMIPLLPLDGGRVLYSLLSGPIKYAYGRMERHGMLLLMLLLILPPLLGFNLLQEILTVPTYWLAGSLLMLTGNGQ